MSFLEVRKELRNISDKNKAQLLQKYFKTGEGEYGEGDKFIGVSVPNCRKIANKYKESNFKDVKKLLSSKIHEQRLTALLILVKKYKKASAKGKRKIINFYLNNLKYVNNWDLVDLSCHKILGDFIYNNPDRGVKVKGRKYYGLNILKILARSNNLWERRISIISTFKFLKHNRYKPTLDITTTLVNDKHDLIHKAVGWSLREVGKRDRKTEEEFLRKYYKTMPRTMLRYAIERFPKSLRQKYLKGSVDKDNR
jgi:3-methyladenine DNA glycosylase AlkD